MDMEDTLTGCRPYIYADIVAVGIELIVQQAALLGYQLHASLDLFGRQVEKTGDMSTRDDQGMPRAYRIAVTRAIREFAIQGHPFWVCTKQTRVIGIALFIWLLFRRQTSTPWSSH